MADTNLDEISSFRGGAGEVVRGFASFATLLTLLPVALLMALVGAGAALIMKLVDSSLPVAVFVALLSSSPIVGRFAMAARQGDLSAGFLSAALAKGDVLGFVARHAVLVLIWGTPLALVGAWLMRRMEEQGMEAAFSSGTIAIVLLVLGVVGQSLSLLVATKGDSVREVLTRDMWRWVWSRRSDWAPFLAALIGGAALFAALVWPVFGLLSLLLVRSSPAAAVVLGVMTYAAPGLAAPVLYGRLCGAFVFGEEAMGQTAAATPVHVGPIQKGAVLATTLAPPTEAGRARAPVVVLPTIPTPGPQASGDRALGNSAVQAVRRVPVDQAIGQLRLKAASDLAGAIKDAEILRQAYSAHPLVAAEWARLLAKAGRSNELPSAAVAAIGTALSAGTGPLAVELFLEFAEMRERLVFPAPTLESLARTLLQRTQHEHALWCFAALARMGADATRVQKGLIAVAEAVARAGDPDRAKAIFDQILARYPDSTFAAYIDDARGRL